MYANFHPAYAFAYCIQIFNMHLLFETGSIICEKFFFIFIQHIIHFRLMVVLLKAFTEVVLEEAQTLILVLEA